MTRTVPIGAYGLIGDTRSAALVAPDGAIDWCCLPRFDSAPVFGQLLDDRAGTFSITPVGVHAADERSYRRFTATLDTRWRVGTADVVLTDTMVGEVGGRLLPSTLLVRQVRAHGGRASIRVRFSPRFGYRHDPPVRASRRAGALVVEHADLAIAVTSDAPGDLAPDRELVFEVAPDRPVTFVVSVAHRGPAVIVPPTVACREVARDQRGWRTWADEVRVAGPHHDAVVRSLLTLQLLTYSPSGAPVAAPTTSLPEHLGGTRNWDYRYAWPRDASIGVAAFLAAGRPKEATSFLAWLRHAGRLARPRLPAMFDLDGRPVPPERELPGWSGYGGSAPVRVGNGATAQHQLDGYGWVIDAAALYERAGHRLDGETWRSVAGFADHLAATWRRPDAGIWERRDEPRHHVHSKLMAWLGLDRAGELAAARGRRAARRRERWTVERDALADDIRRHGFDDEAGSYTAAYGTTDVDAALLLLPILGFEPPTSPRVTGTVDAVRRRLGAGGPLLYRYVADDGLEGREGAFLPCSFWLVQALAATGRRDEAEEMFGELVALGGPLGLYGEELDPTTGTQLGNYPQALTHAALLQAAYALEASGSAAAPCREDGA
jgi:GH15 family glucan-1,4-alpha-glucosidase